MAKAKIVPLVGEAAVRQALAGDADQLIVATATRYLLQVLGEAHPGNTVEVLVPPFGAIQCVEGPTHTRGTPPNVVETDPATWIAVATGATGWGEALAAARITASGQRADLSGMLPVRWEREAQSAR